MVDFKIENPFRCELNQLCLPHVLDGKHIRVVVIHFWYILGNIKYNYK